MMTAPHLTGVEIDRHRNGARLAKDRACHAENCPRCNAAVRGYGEMWDLLGDAVPAPASDSWPEIAHALARERVRNRHVKRAAFAAAAVVALAASLWGASRVASHRQDTPEAAAGPGALDASRPAAERLANVLALGGRGPAGETWRPLLAALEQDPDEHVRIAALDALEHAVLAGTVSQETLLDALRRERSPLLQADLVDLLLRRDGAAAIPLLQNALSADNIHPFVRRKLADWI